MIATRSEQIAREIRAVVYAPVGRDAVLAVTAMERAGLTCEAAETLDDLCATIVDGAGCVILERECLTEHAIGMLQIVLNGQETWSDMPVLILSNKPSSTDVRLMGPGLIANITQLERPLRTATLVSAVQSALRARRRQYEVRDHIAERERQAIELRRANEREQAQSEQANAVRAQLEMVLGSISDQFYIVDRDWNLRYVNQRVVQAHQQTREILLNRTLWDLYPEPDSSTPLIELRRVFEHNVSVEFHWFRRETSDWFDCRAYPTADGLALFLTDITERMTAEAERKLQLERQQHIAETLQRSLLPTPQTYKGIEVNTQYEAASEEAEVGGDFYDVFPINESTIALIVGDVVGKGLEAATHTAEVRFSLRAMLQENKNPGLALERMNGLLIDGQRLEGRAQDHLVAISLAVIDISTKRVTFAVASSDPPTIIGSDGSAREVQVGGVVLGGNAKTHYQTADVSLQAGDIIVLLTDGITEARRGREFFGYEGAQRAAVKAASSGALDKIGASIVSEAKAFGGGALRDDACILVARLSQSQSTAYA